MNVKGIAANSQARTQQWEAYATSGAAPISLLPLISKDVYLSDVEAENIDYRQRPRLRPDRDYSETLAFFPPITGREVVPVDTTELKKKRPRKIHVNDLAASGDHRFWVFNLQGTGSGSVLGNLYTETRGGTLPSMLPILISIWVPPSSMAMQRFMRAAQCRGYWVFHR